MAHQPAYRPDQRNERACAPNRRRARSARTGGVVPGSMGAIDKAVSPAFWASLSALRSEMQRHRAHAPTRMRRLRRADRGEWPSAAPLAGGYRYPHRPIHDQHGSFTSAGVVLTDRGHFERDAKAAPTVRRTRDCRSPNSLQPAAEFPDPPPPVPRQHRPGAGIRAPGGTPTHGPAYHSITVPTLTNEVPLAGDARSRYGRRGHPACRGWDRYRS